MTFHGKSETTNGTSGSGLLREQSLATIDEGLVRVEIRRPPGSARLQMVASVTGYDQEVSVSAETSDLVLARSMGYAFALQLQRSVANGILDPGALARALRNPTYETLRGTIGSRFKDSPNYRTALRAYFQATGISPSDEIGAEFGADFRKNELQLRRALQASGKQPSTINSYLTRLRSLSAVAAELVCVDSEYGPFATVLRAGMAATGIEGSELGHRLGVPFQTISNWQLGTAHPGRRHSKLVPRLEEILGIRAGELQKLVPSRPPMPAKNERDLFPFALKLQELIQDAGLEARDVARESGCGKATLENWMKGKHEPKVGHRTATIPRLEQALGVEPGALAALLRPLPVSMQKIRWVMTPEQTAEWNLFVDHKTNPLALRLEWKPNAYWKVTKKGCGSAKISLDRVRRYFGYLAAPTSATNELMRGKGRAGESLSLLDFARLDDVLDFLEFNAKRSCEGKDETVHNSNALSFLRFVRSILRPKTGYLWQARYLAWDRFSGPPLDEGEPDPNSSLAHWRQHCAKVYEKLGETLRHLEENKDTLIRPARGYEHISAILSMDRPMEALCLLLKRMQADYTARARFVTSGSRAGMARNLLFVSMIIGNPLRREQWMSMTYREDGTGNLRRNESGDYTLFFPQSEFKTLAGFRQEDYEAAIDPALTPLIDDYLQNHRKHLVGASECDFVFRPSNNGCGSETTTPMNIDSLLSELTHRYLNDYAPRGFRPHGVRHVIATHLVRNYADGIDRAADALHNTREMIIKTYGHLRGRDLTHKAHQILQQELRLGWDALGRDRRE